MWAASLLILVLVVFNILWVLQAADVASRLIAEKNAHKALNLSDEDVIQLANLSNLKHFENVLDSILIPRVVGTQNHELVKQFIISKMKELDWTVETDPFEENTPVFGRLKFENIIATLNPNAKRYVVLACHYDSKYFREYSFVGATDSAVPCAMMINLAFVLDHLLKQTVPQNDVSLRFIFFDGEEAFKEWGPRDSIYGARHLAARWEQTAYPRNNADGTNELHRMDVLVLLDLLGAPDPAFYNYFAETEKWYRKMARAEDRLAKLGQLVQYSVGKREQRYFKRLSGHGGVEDDHIPFQIRGVPILHLIPVPFPREWHTEADNRNAVDLWTVENINKILRVFLAQYLHLQV